VATALNEGISIRDVERELGRLREEMAGPEGAPALRTSSATHIAWVPEDWEAAARAVQEGLAERHPSRLIILFPRPEDPRDELDADVSVVCFRTGGLEREVCAELISIRLNGPRAGAPASVVLPLLVSDLPVFLRWRGALPFGERPLEELVDVVDRLVVDSREWDDPAGGLAGLAAYLPRTAVSDIAWARILPWRRAIAWTWPAPATARRLRVTGPQAESLLLARWLETRLGRELSLERDEAAEVSTVELDGEAVPAPPPDARSPSDLLSEQLDAFGREPVYEETLGAFG
jgi:hypothetical protein